MLDGLDRTAYKQHRGNESALLCLVEAVVRNNIIEYYLH